MKRHLATSVIVAQTLAMLFAFCARAQNITGTITGEVTDPSGAGVATAKITALNVQTGVSYKTGATAAGVYVLALLPTGEYQLTADAAGFKAFVRSGLTLRAEQRMRVDVMLEIGAVSERVQVTGEASMVDTEQATVAATFGLEEFSRLPLGRNALGALLMVPGTTEGVRGSGGD